MFLAKQVEEALDEVLSQGNDFTPVHFVIPHGDYYF